VAEKAESFFLEETHVSRKALLASKLSKKALWYYCGENVCESLSLHVSPEQFPNYFHPPGSHL